MSTRDEPRTIPEAGATLVPDGDCGVCMASAAWLGQRVDPRALRLLPLAEAADDPLVGPRVAGRDLRATLHLVTPDGSILTGSRAVMGALRLVPRWRLVAVALDHRVGHAIMEPVYRQVAAHRHRIGRVLGLPAACAIRPPATTPH